MREYDPELVVEFPGRSVVIIRQEGGWGGLKMRSPFDTSSPEHCTFVTCLDLFRFPHWFIKILCSWVWLISLTTCWCVLFLRRWILTRLLLCGFVDINRQYATRSRGRSRSRCRDPWVGCSLRPKLIALDFRKRTIEKIVNLGGNHTCFRKSLSLTINLVRFDFSSMSLKFPFFLLFPQNRQLGHTGGVRREVRKRPARRYSHNGPGP